MFFGIETTGQVYAAAGKRFNINSNPQKQKPYYFEVSKKKKGCCWTESGTPTTISSVPVVRSASENMAQQFPFTQMKLHPDEAQPADDDVTS